MTNVTSQVVQGDCLDELALLGAETVDLVYLDPPFFTRKNHTSVTRDRSKKFSFSDLWGGMDEYAKFMSPRLAEVRRILKQTGSVFLHCDTSANFLLRALLDDIFGADQFRSEIIWSYRRWSNSAKGLMPSHQTILFYSKSGDYKFNKVYTDYSETTNIDQILQLRTRDEHGVSTYATDEAGNAVLNGDKKGVPLNDVWEIPFLNPKAKERVGYPTQKPIILLERILEIASEPGDFIVDPFCGSGTTLVAASLLGRNALGIDISREAVELSRERIRTPAKTESNLMKKGRASYANADTAALGLLQGLDIIPVQRNAGIDAFLRTPYTGAIIPIKVQRESETLNEAASLLFRASLSKNANRAILVRTHDHEDIFATAALPDCIEVVDAPAFGIKSRLAQFLTHSSIAKLDGHPVPSS